MGAFLPLLTANLWLGLVLLLLAVTSGLLNHLLDRKGASVAVAPRRRVSLLLFGLAVLTLVAQANRPPAPAPATDKLPNAGTPAVEHRWDLATDDDNAPESPHRHKVRR
jgi:hypothetical protein